MKKVIFTGGGSGGHVIPALTLINELKKHKVKIAYIGSEKAIESELVPENKIEYYAIKTGKLRRYFSWQNFTDIFRLSIGIFQAFIILLKEGGKKNVLVFSTGGYISVPVAIACKLLGVDLYIHEQTSRVGLANKIASRFAKKVFISFEESKDFFPSSKVIHSGYPIREEFFKSYIRSDIMVKGRALQSKLPLLFITGGGNGSLLINQKIESVIDELKRNYQIVHQVGAQFAQHFEQYNDEKYISTDFIGPEMAALFSCADVIISRSGAGTVAELMAMRKRSIFIPLKIAQKNEQFHNAMAAKTALGSWVIEEDHFKGIELLSTLKAFCESTPEVTSEQEDLESFSRARQFLVDQILRT